MNSHLPFELIYKIVEYCDANTMRQIGATNRFYRNIFRELIYHYHMMSGKSLLLDEYLLKDVYGIPHYSYLEKLLNYLKSKKDMIIVGDYVMDYYREIQSSKDTTIDIYCRNGDDAGELFRYIKSHYTVIKYQSVNYRIVELEIAEIPHKIDIYLTGAPTLTSLFMSLDGSHLRCGIYCGHLYMTMDAFRCKQSLITYYHRSKVITLDSVQNAIHRGFKVFELSDEDTEELKLVALPLNKSI